jgi:phosphoribosyl 1,2-cyclic phosphodiesterase
LIIIDAGTGIIGLGNKLVAQHKQGRQPIRGTLLFTHGHHDHTQGLAFFTPLKLNDSVFHIFGPRMPDADLEDVLREAMMPSVRPFQLKDMFQICQIRNVHENQAIILSQPDLPPVIVNCGRDQVFVPPWSVVIRMYHSHNHPKGGTICYQVAYRGKRLVFATDTEGYEGGDTGLIKFARGADLLVHDSEYTDQEYTGPPFCRQGWGHSTWRIAVEVGQLAGVKRLALTHHHANHDDTFMRGIEEEAQAVFPKAFMVREGMTVEL